MASEARYSNSQATPDSLCQGAGGTHGNEEPLLCGSPSVAERGETYLIKSSCFVVDIGGQDSQSGLSEDYKAADNQHWNNVVNGWSQAECTESDELLSRPNES